VALDAMSGRTTATPLQRTMADRAQGARRLLLRLAAVTAIQMAAALFAVLPR
jgi:hypothetical protein